MKKNTKFRIQFQQMQLFNRKAMTIRVQLFVITHNITERGEQYGAWLVAYFTCQS